MGGSVGGGSGGPMADINVTPLIDVVLVLLVVFMVITPMLASGKEVDLPMSTSATTIQDTGQFIVISMTADGRWWVEFAEADPDTFIELVQGEFNLRPESTLLVKADRNLKYSEVRELLDLLNEYRFSHIQLATGKEN
ncbi:MAG: biopolymer transport protein TolR [Kiritimatiellia bacterium]|jgi:biopolymer transport protein TolR